MLGFYFSNSDFNQILKSTMKVVNLDILMISLTFVQFSNCSKLVYIKTTTRSLSGYITLNDFRHQEIHSQDGKENQCNGIGAKFNFRILETGVQVIYENEILPLAPLSSLHREKKVNCNCQGQLTKPETAHLLKPFSKIGFRVSTRRMLDQLQGFAAQQQKPGQLRAGKARYKTHYAETQAHKRRLLALQLQQPMESIEPHLLRPLSPAQYMCRGYG